MKRIMIIGASGAIGASMCEQLAEHTDTEKVIALSRSGRTFSAPNIVSDTLDLTNEASIAAVAERYMQDNAIDTVIITSGLLHDESRDIQPEKALKDMTAERFNHVFAVNTFGPALVMKHMLPLMPHDKRIVFAALSARVGSISDNGLGGWYAYRASKTALNMLLKNAAIETSRRNKHAVIVGLHPGTVDSDLSAPFQSHVKEHALFTPEYSASKMLDVLRHADASSSGACIAYDGSIVLP